MMNSAALRFLSVVFAAMAAAEPLSFAQESFAIDFHRPLKPGMEFECDVRASHSRRYSISMPGVEQPAVRFESAEALLSGKMKVAAVNGQGNPVRSEFEVSSLSGSIDGEPAEFPSLKGATVSVNLEKSPCEFALKASGAPLDKRAATLLSTVFRPASNDSLKDILGAEKPLAIGERWTPSTKALLASLAHRKMEASPENVESSAVLLGKESFKGIDCWKIDGLMQSKGIPGVDFRLSLSILLPCDPKLGGAVRISRSGVEVVNRSLPDNPLSAGKTMEAIVKDSMTAELTPLPR